MLIKHPTLNDLYFAPDGTPFKDADGKIPYTINYGYPSITCDGKSTALHRLVAGAFHGIDLNKPVVNHLDGDKRNYHPDNLEWTTFSGNSNHAYESGLREDNKALKIWDAKTRTFSQKHSLQETARFIGVNASLIHDYLRAIDNGRRYLFRKRWVIAPTDFDWKELLLLSGTENGVGVRSKIYAVHSLEKKVLIFESRMHACRHFGIKQYKMETLLNGKNDNYYNGWKFLYRLEDTTIPVNEFEHQELIDTYIPGRSPVPTRKPLPVTVTDIRTGIVNRWGSLREFGNSIGVKHNTIGKAINVNAIDKDSGRYRDYIIRYLR